MTRIRAVLDERWPIAERFVIARGAKTQAHVVVVELEHQGRSGRGECVPYARYGESVEGVMHDLRSVREEHLSLDKAQSSGLRGAALCALDLALWDLRAQLEDESVCGMLGLPPPPYSLPIARTLSIDSPDRMHSRASQLDSKLIKIKLAGDALDVDRVRAVRSAAPNARLWLDANEGWTVAHYARSIEALAELSIEMIEQPFRRDEDGALRELPRPIPVCADESVHDASSIAPLVGFYDIVNLKLDKTGGLSGALGAFDAAREAGLRVALGCMVSTSLAIAPACLLARSAEWLDLDGSILLARDREGGAHLLEGELNPPARTLWGWPR